MNYVLQEINIITIVFHKNNISQDRKIFSKFENPNIFNILNHQIDN